MIFTFCEDAGIETLQIKDELFKYLIKVRRHKLKDLIALRSPQEREWLYMYELDVIEPRYAMLKLKERTILHVTPERALHLGWCLIDPKSIEKVLPMLNEMGVEQITFITCKRSQSNFRLDLKRFERILETSSQQCGRSTILTIRTASSLEAFLKNYPDVAVLDFSGKLLQEEKPNTVLIGCEGGFDEQERQLLRSQPRFRFDTPMVLRSESAATAISSKILL